MLPDTPDVERVLDGPEGRAVGARAGALVIDMSASRLTRRGGSRRASRKARRCSTRP
jgi:3-hydroxyisobutyrate dehydrogenase-like beta-hydroxyacid dehydrogenase